MHRSIESIIQQLSVLRTSRHYYYLASSCLAEASADKIAGRLRSYITNASRHIRTYVVHDGYLGWEYLDICSGPTANEQASYKFKAHQSSS